MTSDRLQRIQELYHSVQEAAAEERAALLGQADPELRGIVESLLAHRSEDLILDRSAPLPAEWLEVYGSGDREFRLNSTGDGKAFVEDLIAQYLGPDRADFLAECALSPTLESGSQFGRYSIRGFIGSGGMGAVYLARDTQLQRDVALKILPSWLGGEEQLVGRFAREALAASRLNHPNVPVVYEAGEIDHRHFIASEYVDGFPLTHRIKQAKVPWREAVALAHQVALALSAAHNAGIVHRDIKPGNILVRKVDGQVKLVDFGIARIAEGFELRPENQASLTAIGVVIGTPGYMSPEQASGRPVDGRSDIWSLAAVLQEMVTGRPLVPGSAKAERSPDLPAPLAAVLKRALEPEPGLRYQTAAAFAHDLSTLQRKVLPFRSFAAVAAALLIGVGTLLFLQTRKRVEPRIVTEKPEELTEKGTVRDAIISPDSRYVIYSVAESGRESLRLREVRTGADEERIPYKDGNYIGLTFAPDGDHFYYTFDPHADLRDLYEASVIRGDIEPRKIIHDIDSPVAISPDGRQIAYLRGIPARKLDELHVANIDGSHDRVLIANSSDNPFTKGGVVWSKDGKQIYAAELRSGSFELVSIDVSRAQRQVMSGPDWSYVGRISLLKDGDTLIFPAETAQSPIAGLFQYRIGRREGKRLTPEGERYLSGYSAGGDIVSVRQDRRASVSIVPANAPDAATIITPPAGRYDQVAWASGGGLIVNLAQGAHEDLWRVSLDSTKQLLTDGPYRYNYLTGSPDGHSLAFSTDSAEGYGIWILDNDTHDLRQIARAPLEVQSPTFTPDGWVLFGRQGDGIYQIWRVRKTGGEASPLMRMVARSPSVSPSGKYLVCRLLDETSDKWRVAVIDLRTLKVIGQYAKIPSGSRVKWSPGETTLTYVRDVQGVSNIWETRIGNGSESPLTRFKELKIFSFDWSPDGRNLGIVRGIDASDVVLFRYSE